MVGKVSSRDSGSSTTFDGTTAVTDAHAGFSEDLRQRHRALWDAAHRDHPFVQGIGDGSLDLDRFRYYMRQDYVYLVDYCRVFGLAAAKTHDLDSMGQWAELLNETLNSEMALHRSFCGDFGITQRDLESTRPSPTTLAYTRHLLTVAWSASIEEIAAAILPCQWGYDEIGRRLSHEGTAPNGSLHERWIAGYASAEYQSVTAWLKAFLDHLGAEASPLVQARMSEVFRESTRLEKRFWDAAWEMEPET